MSNQLENFLREDYSKWGERNYLYEKKDGANFSPITFGEFIENVNYFAAYLIDKGFYGKNIGIGNEKPDTCVRFRCLIYLRPRRKDDGAG